MFIDPLSADSFLVVRVYAEFISVLPRNDKLLFYNSKNFIDLNRVFPNHIFMIDLKSLWKGD